MSTSTMLIALFVLIIGATAQKAWLLGSLLTSMLRITYITFYNSRVVGYFCTKIINRFSSKGVGFKIGSLTINPIAGKIMFRDIVFVCCDYSFRALDGYFQWWRTYVPKDVSEDLSHSDTRLSVMLNGLEEHVYNRSELYAKLERTFGLKPSILVPTENMTADECAKLREMELNSENERKNCHGGKKKKVKPEAMAATTWRDLIPVIKIYICTGRFVFGNRLTPTTLSICVEEAHCVYITKPAVSRFDRFMHFVKAKADNAMILLAPSQKYTGLVDDPPRYMGEGFVVMMSNLVEMHMYMDEPESIKDLREDSSKINVIIHNNKNDEGIKSAGETLKSKLNNRLQYFTDKFENAQKPADYDDEI